MPRCTLGDRREAAVGRTERYDLLPDGIIGRLGCAGAPGRRRRRLPADFRPRPALARSDQRVAELEAPGDDAVIAHLPVGLHDAARQDDAQLEGRPARQRVAGQLTVQIIVDGSGLVVDGGRGDVAQAGGIAADDRVAQGGDGGDRQVLVQIESALGTGGRPRAHGTDTEGEAAQFGQLGRVEPRVGGGGLVAEAVGDESRQHFQGAVPGEGLAIGVGALALFHAHPVVEVDLGISSLMLKKLL